jgi:predicted PurR-regulated permease PerM
VIGGALAGLPGAILAIPTAALLSVIVEEIAAERESHLQRIK